MAVSKQRIKRRKVLNERKKKINKAVTFQVEQDTIKLKIANSVYKQKLVFMEKQMALLVEAQNDAESESVEMIEEALGEVFPEATEIKQEMEILPGGGLMDLLSKPRDEEE